MGQSESKETKLRSLLKVRSYGECFEEDRVTYVPTRSIVVTIGDGDIPFTKNYLQAILTRYIDTEKSVSHIDRTDNSSTKWVVTFQSEEEMELNLETLAQAKEEDAAELKMYQVYRGKGNLAISGLSETQIPDVEEYFKSYVRNPKATYNPRNGLTVFAHDGVERTIQTKVEIGNRPYPEVVKTTQQSRHVMNTLEDLEKRFVERLSSFHIAKGLISHECGDGACPACEEIY